MSPVSSLFFFDLIVIDVEIEVMMSVEIDMMLMRKEIGLFDLTEKGSNGNIIHHEFEVIEFFDGQTKSSDFLHIQLQSAQCTILHVF